MDGPAHYREAERLLTHVSDPRTQEPPVRLAGMIAAAQAHATLALAAATADALPPHRAHDWRGVTS